MEKIKTFFKKVWNIVYDLCIDSNRWMHIIAGGIIYTVMMAAIAIWTPYAPIPLQCCFGATIATLIAMCAVEYKDKAKGGVFDWKDILAGMFPAIFIDILAIILLLCV